MSERDSSLKVAGGGFDLIGDLHGHAGPLHRLLDRLGYHTKARAYRIAVAKAQHWKNN